MPSGRVRCAAIVPAFNEGARIARVIGVASRSACVDEVLVVNDGSTDDTLARVPVGNGVRAISLERNCGKGAAMAAGVSQTEAEVVLFLDADLVGLTPDHVTALLSPVLAHQAEMSIGLFRRGRRWTDWSQMLVPYISGQRALRKALFVQVPDLTQTRAGVEVALTCWAKRHRIKVVHVPLGGVTHVLKEEKMGLLPGAGARMRMYGEIFGYLARQQFLNGVNHSHG